MSSNPFNDIREMYSRFGFTQAAKRMNPETLEQFFDFRKSLLSEETKELFDAVTPEDKVDALIDIVVIALGTLEAFGVDAQQAWDEVHRANMSKSPGQKPGRHNPWKMPDMVKPSDFQDPDHSNNTGIIP